MAEIQIVYREPYCQLVERGYPGCDCFNTQCFTGAARDAGCRWFSDGREPDSRRIPFGNCVNAKFRYCYKGLVAKKYSITPEEDGWNPHLNCMVVDVNGESYDCDKVILNGKCIYNEYDAEDGEDA